MEYLESDRIKKIELEMLIKLASYLDSHNLYYVLNYGTLLGAIRHKGFIPWDDDIDIMMPREDYRKLLELYKNGNVIEGCELLFSQDDNEYYYPFAKLCDTKTIAKMEDNVTQHGIWIDIFPVDKVPESRKDSLKLHRKIRFLLRVIIAMTTDFKHIKPNIKVPVKFLFSIYGNIVGKKKITNILERNATKFCNTNSRYVCPIVAQSNSLDGEMIEADFLIPIKVEFEGYKFNAPSNYDAYLKNIYGDYMKLPPENKRRTHGVIAYVRN